MKKVIIYIVISVFLLACGSKSSVKTQKRFIVSTQAIHKTLHFSGVIQPRSEYSLLSPVEATVEKIYYNYGQMVPKNKTVLTLHSAELQKQFNDNLTEYLKAKDSFAMMKTKFTGTEELWKAGLLSRNNYLSEQSSLATAEVSFIQAEKKLLEMLQQTGSNPLKLSDLSITDTNHVNQILNTAHNVLAIKATTQGLLLYPPKSGEDKANKLTVGMAVKSGQVLALIGDISGIRIEIEIPEVDITAVHPGMTADITGVALGSTHLKGRLLSVNTQATTASGNVLPSFSAIVEVKQLTKNEQALIKIGMSTAIELSIESQHKLLIPINAVEQKQAVSWVKVLDKHHKIMEKKITTGAAFANKVVVESGLVAGDTVIYDD